MPPKTRRASQQEESAHENKKPKVENYNKDEQLSGEKENGHDKYEKQEVDTAIKDTTNRAEKEKPTEEKKSKTSAKHHDEHEKANVLERGKLVFYYRPKIGEEEIQNASDIQRFVFAMSPDTGKTHRALVVGSKKFPEKGSRARVFAFVEKVSSSIDELNKQLRPYDYETKTRGERHQEGSRVAGEAVYELVQHGPDHVHLAYVLEIPDEPSETQKIFGIHKEDALVCMVKNPGAGPSSSGAQGLGGQQKAQFPAKLMEHFKGKTKSSVRFTALQPEFLDYEGCELLMIATGKDPKMEFKEIMEDLEKEAEEDEKKAEKETHHHPSDQIYKERHLDKKENPDATTELK